MQLNPYAKCFYPKYQTTNTQKNYFNSKNSDFNSYRYDKQIKKYQLLTGGMTEYEIKMGIDIIEERCINIPRTVGSFRIGRRTCRFFA